MCSFCKDDVLLVFVCAESFTSVTHISENIFCLLRRPRGATARLEDGVSGQFLCHPVLHHVQRPHLLGDQSRTGVQLVDLGRGQNG